MTGEEMKTEDKAQIRQEKAALLKARKGGLPIAMVTAYDYPTARLLDEEGMDSLLVGDSVGMVVMGYPDTVEVVLADMIHHTRMVARANPKGLLVTDMPINTYRTVEEALETGHLLVEAGAEAVKLEGGVEIVPQVKALVEAGIPVVGHVGLLPQKVREEGGYKIKGKTEDEAARLEKDIVSIAEAGASLIVVEGVTGAVARRMTDACSVPTIGIGSGKGTCDGDVVVIADLIGSFPWYVPGFITPKADVAGVSRQAVREWVDEIRK